MWWLNREVPSDYCAFPPLVSRQRLHGRVFTRVLLSGTWYHSSRLLEYSSTMIEAVCHSPWKWWELTLSISITEHPCKHPLQVAPMETRSAGVLCYGGGGAPRLHTKHARRDFEKRTSRALCAIDTPCFPLQNPLNISHHSYPPSGFEPQSGVFSYYILFSQFLQYHVIQICPLQSSSAGTISKKIPDTIPLAHMRMHSKARGPRRRDHAYGRIYLRWNNIGHALEPWKPSLRILVWCAIHQRGRRAPIEQN